MELEHGNMKAYLWGFFLSMALTLAAYFTVAQDLLTGRYLIGAIIALALLQAIVQLILFLHLGTEHKPHWNSLVFFFMAMVVLILVFGSLWIMHNLDYNDMPPMDMMR
jgi:cytochrome o ubiquinol oxidase operon protein cyoD